MTDHAGNDPLDSPVSRRREWVVYDQPSPCPYLPNRIARTPLRLPAELSPVDFDDRLNEGDRRMGGLLYRTQCPGCRACEAIRIPIRDFTPHRTLRRTLAKGDALLECRIGPAESDEQRIALFNLHKHGRGLNRGEGEIDDAGYREFLVDTCTTTLEFSYWHESRLVAAAVSDCGSAALNAVYCYFDPSFELLGLGTYNVLRQIEQCRTWGLDYLYLGYYVAGSPHMQYKAKFLPHERLIDGCWRGFERE